MICLTRFWLQTKMVVEFKEIKLRLFDLLLVMKLTLDDSGLCYHGVNLNLTILNFNLTK